MNKKLLKQFLTPKFYLSTTTSVNVDHEEKLKLIYRRTNEFSWLQHVAKGKCNWLITYHFAESSIVIGRNDRKLIIKMY
jgi:hypothetical protein